DGLAARLDLRVVGLDLLRPRVVGPEAFEQRERRHAADGEFLRALEKIATRDLAVLILMEKVEQLLGIIRRSLSVHGDAPRVGLYTAGMRRAAIVLAAVVSSGCLVVSLQPVYDDKSITFEEPLLGKWSNTEDQIQATIERGEWRSYKVTYTD